MTTNAPDLQAEELTNLPIDSIVPYWRNPRNTTDQDIARVMRSIEEYGYQAPIIVDTDHVIIVGHTRYLALRRLGWKEIPVLVTDMSAQAAREYRIIDNRAGEFVQWDREGLLQELRGFTNPGMLSLYFPEVDLDLTDISNEALLPPAMPPPPEPVPLTQVEPMCICPHCYHEFALEDQ